jgi:hypothetical protein
VQEPEKKEKGKVRTKIKRNQSADAEGEEDSPAQGVLLIMPDEPVG